MVKTRLLALLGAFLVGFAPMAAYALVAAPAYTSGGSVVGATGVFCLNLDGTSCSFAGGGGGGGGGGAVTAAASSYATGFSPDLGKIGDTACATDNGALCDLIQLTMRTNQRTTAIITALGSPLQAGGSVGISGTLPDTGAGDLAAIRASLASPTVTFAGTATVTVTRPADTTLYAVNDAFADSTSAPTSGGFTFSNVCSASGKTSTLSTLVVVSSNDPATTLQGELWLFNTSVTAVNDNAAFALSDADSIKLVTKIPFALETSTGGSGTNSIYVATGLDTRVTCSGSANLRALVKVKNAYTPASTEAVQFALSFKGDN